jgi:hypothetical protein
MPWNGSVGIPFTVSSVFMHAPKVSGVYALFTDKTWICFEESDDIHGALMEHISKRASWTRNPGPKYFAFEPLTGPARGLRKKTLNTEYSPAFICHDANVASLQKVGP